MKIKEKKQKQQIDMLEANEKELAKKNHSNQKVNNIISLTYHAALQKIVETIVKYISEIILVGRGEWCYGKTPASQL